MKALLLDLVPLLILGFAWIGIKNMDRPAESQGRLVKYIPKLNWTAWIMTLVLALAMAIVILKSVL